MKVNTNEKNILQVTCFGHFLSHFNMLVFPAVLIPLSETLQISMVETLALSFWMYLLFGVTALPWGLLADKISARALLIIFYTGAGVCGLVAAFSTQNAAMFGLSLTGIGLFSGIYHPVGLGWIARNIENTSLAMGYNGMFGNLGLATAPLVAGLINYGFGLKAVYCTLGLLNLLGIILLLRTKNNGNMVEIKRKNNQQNNSFIPFIILLVAMMLGGIVYRGTSVTLPAYFQLSNQELFTSIKTMFGGFGTENVVATLITSMIYLLGMVGQFIGGKVGENYDLRRSYLLFHLITIPAAAAMAFSSNIPLIGFAMVHSFFLLGMQPIENTLVSRLAPAGLLSSAYGLKFILTFGVGALSVKVIEAVKLSFGFSTIYLVLAIVSLFLVSTIIVLMTQTSPLTVKQ